MPAKQIHSSFRTPHIALIATCTLIGLLITIHWQSEPAAAAPTQQADPINFFGSGLQGANVESPTSLQFGPDERLYVAQQDGTIFAYTVQRNGQANYAVTATEVINLVKQMPNRNDDGQPNNEKTQRQVTGIYVTGTFANPVLYVTSSDWRIGGGAQESDTNLDTNSGIISRLTWDSVNGVWDKVDLVRGLPRSEENHSTNGMALDQTTNTLYVMSGGNTNAGGTSAKFAMLSEYALATALLTVDLDAIDAMPTQGSGNTKYKYDLPTLDDPTRANVNGVTDPNDPSYNGIDVGDPFGGNDGLNQAKWDPTGPVQVYATGLRNAYDVVLTESGRLYTVDNGGNNGWGGYPVNEGPGGTCTNEYDPDEPGKVVNKDNLHYITGPGYYAGHPNPVRGNPSGAGLLTDDGSTQVWRSQITGDPATSLPVDWPPVPVELANPIECDYQIPGDEDPSLERWTSSTNGITEYTASNFDGALQGNLLAAAFDGHIYRVILNAAGDTVLNDEESFASAFGSTPLDVVAQGDGDVFAGTVWAATYGEDAITVFEPADYDGIDPGSCTPTDPNADSDGDTYSNGDEEANGTNPCSAASKPADNDLDGVSDLNDSDDDNDSIPDTADRFPIDPDNGLSTQLPIDYPLLNNDPGFGFFGLGFTGLMLNDGMDYLDFFDTDNLVAGGAVGLFTITDAGPGDAHQALNSQREAFHFGIDVDTSTGPFTVRATTLGAFFQPTPTDFQSQGIYIGTGDQDHYVKVVISAQQGGSIQVVQEANGSITHDDVYPVAGILDAANVDLYLTVNPVAGTVQPQYVIQNGTPIPVGAPLALAANVLQAAQSSSQALAVGVIATSRGNGSPAPTFIATWDHIAITQDVTAPSQWTPVESSDGSTPLKRHENGYVAVGDQFFLLGGRGTKGVNVFDPASRTWVTRDNKPPFEIHHFQAVEWGGKIYIVGAFTGKYPDETPLSNVYIYDPASDEWLEGPEIPESRRRGSAGAVVYNDKIYIVAGLQNGHQSGWVPWLDEFDPATGQWTPLADAPRARDHFHAAVIDGKLYAAGGRLSGQDGNTYKATVAEVDVYDFNTEQWSTMANPIPTQRAGTTAVAVGDELLVIGGESLAHKEAHSETEALNVKTGDWRTLAALNQGRHGTQAILYGNEVYIASGSAERGSDEIDTQEKLILYSSQPAALLTALPNALSFGAQLQNTSSLPRPITLTNIGDTPLTINDVSLTGPDAGAFAHDFSGPQTLNASDKMTVHVTFTPPSAGAKSATLSIEHTGQGSPLEIALSGTGTESDSQNTPPTLVSSLPDVTLDVNGAAQTVDLSNVFADAEDATLTLSYFNPNPDLVDSSLSGSTLTLTPGGTGGTTEITVRATDSGGMFVEDTFSVTVSGTQQNMAPTVVDPEPGYTMPSSGSLYVDLRLLFDDVEEGADGLTFAVVEPFPLLLIAEVVNEHFLEVMLNNRVAAQEDQVTVRATDSGNQSAEVTISITIPDTSSGNSAPTLTEISFPSVMEGQQFMGTVSATDPDGDPITLAVGGLPEDAVFSDHGDGTGTLTWTPGAGSAGEHTIIVFATDDEGLADSQMATITVTAAGSGAPAFGAFSRIQRLREGEPFSLAVTATDPNGLPIQLGAAELPGDATFTDHGDGTATLNWTPDYDAAGSYIVRLTATNTNGSTTADVTLIVDNVNRPPQIETIVGQTVESGAALTVPIAVSDPDGDPVTIELSGQPADAVFTDNGDGTATLTWTDARAGESYTVTITATDIRGLSTTATFTLTVVSNGPIQSRLFLPFITRAGAASR